MAGAWLSFSCVELAPLCLGWPGLGHPGPALLGPFRTGSARLHPEETKGDQRILGRLDCGLCYIRTYMPESPEEKNIWLRFSSGLTRFSNRARLSSPQLVIARSRLGSANLALDKLSSVKPYPALFGLARLGAGTAPPRRAFRAFSLTAVNEICPYVSIRVAVLRHV